MCTYGTAVSIYMLHNDLLQSTMWPGTLVWMHFTFLAYAIEKICLPNHTYMSNCTTTMVYIQTQHYCTCKSKKIYKLHLLITMLLPYMCQKQIYRSQIPHACQICTLDPVQIWYNYVNIYASYEFNAINNVTRNTDIHTFILLVFAPEQIGLPYCIYTIHCTSTVVYIQTPHFFYI